MRTQRIRDYGGTPRRRGRRLKVRGNVLSFRCLNCSKLRYVFPRELSRAAQPRCLACGGPLEETKNSHERHIERIEANRVLLAKEAGPVELPKKFNCLGCRAQYQDGAQLTGHLCRSFQCREDYRIKDLVRKFEGEQILLGAFHIEKIRYSKASLLWVVTYDGDRVKVKVRSKKEALAKMRELTKVQT